MNIFNVRREEYKYYINNADIYTLKHLISRVMSIDAYADPIKNHYTVTSLYFDTCFDNDLDEKLDGLLEREKIRLRIYNSEHSTIKLEVKKRNGTVISKDSFSISKNTAINLINNNFDLIDEDGGINSILVKLKLKGYQPRVVVEYDREAYFLPYGNIRVTFDKNPRTYNTNCDLFDLKNTASTPIFLDNSQILEVKFSMPLPENIKNILSLVPLIRCSISKYVLSQRYSDHSQWRDHLISPF